eukprot:5568032-Amphidinium_carterae.1
MLGVLFCFSSGQYSDVVASQNFEHPTNLEDVLCMTRHYFKHSSSCTAARTASPGICVAT